MKANSEGGQDARILREELRRLDLSLTPAQLAGLFCYLQELDRWNRKMNLTGLSGRMRVRRLVIEPIWIATALDIRGTLADVGSGNGSPGIPMSLAAPVESLILVEPRLKRAAFLRHAVSTIPDMPPARVERARLEAIQGTIRVDWIVMQGVALTENLLEALRGVCGRDTRVVWITAGGEQPTRTARRVQVPEGETEAWVWDFTEEQESLMG
ncbi:MAG TPA: RsmG family class I SAM-dependent methyltransferase [Terriglobia bacterium]|nr:RsmG family class I SAM-dependent methyltransferase [Terriglobia bacterium]